jgi:hypothetical protein
MARGEREQKEMAEEIGISRSAYCNAELHGFLPNYGKTRVRVEAYLNRLEAKESGVME